MYRIYNNMTQRFIGEPYATYEEAEALVLNLVEYNERNAVPYDMDIYKLCE